MADASNDITLHGYPSEMTMLQVRVSRALIKRVDHIAIELGGPRSVAIIHLLELGLQSVGYQSPMRHTEPSE